MFNRKLKEIQQEQHRRITKFYDSELSSMRKTAYNQEVAIVALKKEAAIQLEKLKGNEANIQNLLNLTYSLENAIGGLVKVIKASGIIEEAIKGEALFQFRSNVDALGSNPLYKINKVTIQKEK